jgi:hypothetical protein
MVNQWGTIGIPSENRFLGLYYEPESKQFLAHFHKSLGEGYGLKSIYARHITDDTYRRLTPETCELSYEDVLLCPRVSKILVNVFRVVRKGHRFTGPEWHSLQEIDLETGEMNTVLTPDDLSVEPPYSKAWISRLRNVKGEERKHGRSFESPEDEFVHEPGTHAVYGSGGKEILCTVSFKKKKGGHVEAVEDFLCKVSPETHEYRKISRITNAAKDMAAPGKTAGENLSV